ncbi:hypothetical protein B0T22DRAFT_532504 [Podospora appendiculata]|uniref:Uncharacterized protein n=1 Tax=Podospora appendiculata TaxID=314037 RepID=A0AAE1CG81_9PEZI|nr:hypothetical protein B0T22DRAFT_532504 [Podospora appendiculata]
MANRLAPTDTVTTTTATTITANTTIAVGSPRMRTTHAHERRGLPRRAEERTLNSSERLIFRHEQQKRLQAEEKLERLQTEVLASVDRFDPSFDSTISREFQLLNVDIGKLCSKSKLLAKLILSDNSPPISRGSSTLWEDTVQWILFDDRAATRAEKKMLLRQAVWKFLTETLFDRARPFASFGNDNPQANLVERICFDKLFPDHLTSENAARWRSLTVRQLRALPINEQATKQVRKQLALEFVGFIRDRGLIAEGEELLEQVEAAVLNTKEDLGKHLDLVLDRAIGFSRLLAGERAGYELRAPQLSAMQFRKSEDDAMVTAMGGPVGVVDADREDDPEGEIKLIGSPMMVKFGDGGGRNLDEEMVLVKAFAVLVDED